MNKYIMGIFLAITILFVNSAQAAETPSCIMLKFTDDTRFDRVDSAGTLSDMVMEKLLNSGKLNFRETRVIDNNLEEMLYDENKLEFQQAQAILRGADASILFEGPVFAEERANSIDTARLGQIVSPEVIRNIGQQNGAEYIIQGTIQNIGAGGWLNEDITKGVMYATDAISLAAMATATAGQTLGQIPGLGLLEGLEVTESGIGIQADIRIIKASTGEVVWQKRLLGKKMQRQVGVGFLKVGSGKLSNEIYYKAMEDAAMKFANAIIEDATNGNLFSK